MYNPENDDKKSDVWQDFHVGSLPVKIVSKPVYNQYGITRPKQIVLSVTTNIIKRKKLQSVTISGYGQDKSLALVDLKAGLKHYQLTGTLKL